MERMPKQRRLDFSNGGGEDRLSTLPDAILIEILSLLPIKSAVITSVLSRRWPSVWKFITAFRFESSTISNPVQHVSIINHTLSQLQSPQIQTFKLDLYLAAVCPYYVESWVRLLSSRKVQHIEIRISGEFTYGNCIYLPSCLYESKSLISLVLQRVDLLPVTLPQVVSLPNLKILSVFTIRHRQDSLSHLALFCKLLSKTCPRLEELSFSGLAQGDDNNILISSQNLKKLKVIIFSIYGYHPRVDIDAPNLESFDAVFESVTFGFAEEPINTLQAANLKDCTGNAGCSMEVFRAIRCVRTLKLNLNLMDALNQLDDDAQFPIFSNLTNLVCEMSFPACWKALLTLLRRATNLKSLTIVMMSKGSNKANGISKVPIDYSSVPPCSLQRVRNIMIQLGVVGDLLVENEMALMKYFLCNATALEELIVNFPMWRYGGEQFKQQKESELLEILMKLPRSSLSCHIEVHGTKPA